MPPVEWIAQLFPSAHHRRPEIHLRSRPPLLLLSRSTDVPSRCDKGDWGGVSSPAAASRAYDTLTLDAPELSLAGPFALIGLTPSTTGVAGMYALTMERTPEMEAPPMELDWLIVRRCLLSMDRRRRFMACSTERSSAEMVALGDRSASGCGRVVLKSVICVNYLTLKN